MRRTLLSVGGLLVLLLLLAAGATQAVKSGAVQARVSRALSNALDRPVAIGRLGVALLPFPSLSATDVHLDDVASAAPGVAIASVRVVPRWSSLLPGHTVEVRRVDLVGLVIAARRDSAGRWQLPLARHAPRDSASAQDPRRNVVLADLRVHDGTIRVIDERLRDTTGAPAVTSIAHIETTMRMTGGEIALPELSGRVGSTEVSGTASLGLGGGKLALHSPSLRPPDLPAFMTLLGMQAHRGLTIAGEAPFEVTMAIAPGLASSTAAGHVTVEQVRLNKLELSHVDAPFRFADGILTVDPFDFTSYGGREHGVVSVDLKRTPASYTYRGNLQGLEAALLLRATTTTRDAVSGRADLSGMLHGRGHTVADLQRSLDGTLGFELRNGVLRNFPIVAALNQALGVTAGTAQDTKFEVLSGKAVIAKGQARCNDVVLRAGALALTGSGTVRFDHVLRFQFVANFSPGLSGRLVQQVGLLRRLQNNQGQVAIPVTISGTTTAPKIAVDVGSLAKQQLRKQQLRGELAKGLMQLLNQ